MIMIMITVTVHYNISAWRHHLCRGSGHIETHFTNCLYCEIIVTCMLNYFLEYLTTFFTNCQSASDVLYMWHPLVCYAIM